MCAQHAPEAGVPCRRLSALRGAAVPAGWSGAGDISDMFSKALSLGGDSAGGGRSAGAAAAVAPGRGFVPPPSALPATLQASRAAAAAAGKDPQQ